MNFINKNLNEIETLRDAYGACDTAIEGKFQIFRYGDEFYSTITVLPRFRMTVLTHVVSIYLQDNEKYLPPIFLAIEGNAGEGKTSQAIASCIQHGIIVFYISASQLSGSHERDAVDVMEGVYKRARDMKNQGNKVAIVIDDFHLSNASINENIKRTINSSLLTGYLMNLTQNEFEEKVPIILTGNDFSQVYSPLIRAGRADHFKWNPNYDEKKTIVKNVFNDFIQCNTTEFEHFFARCSNSSIAEFAQLKNDFRKSIISSYINNMKIIDDGEIKNISKFVAMQKRKASYESLMELAKRRKMWGD